MAVSKLICPECNTVLRPAKPLPPGKPVRCPECGHRFTAPEEDAPRAPLKKPKKAAADEPEAAERKPKKAADAAKAVPKKAAPAAEKKPAAKKDDDDDEGGIYGYVKEDEAEEEDKPDIEYAPDMSTKDLRGPAVSALVQPSNALIIVGGAGFFGWLALIFLHLFPILFPLDSDEGDKTKPPKPVVEIESALAAGAVNLSASKPGANTTSGPPTLPPEQKPSAKASAPYMAYILMDPSAAVRFSWLGKSFIFLVMILGMVYSGFVAYGAVRIQNLDGYGWGMAACIMAIVPFWALWGLSSCLAQLPLCFLLGMVIDDPFVMARMWNAVIALPILAGMAVGVWGLMTLRSETVVKGFEYKAE